MLVLGIAQVANAGVCARVDRVMDACCCDGELADEATALELSDRIQAGCCCDAGSAPGLVTQVDVQLPPSPDDTSVAAPPIELPVTANVIRAALVRRGQMPQAGGPPRSASLIAQHTLLLC